MSVSHDRELPWPPPKRQEDFVTQFSECLFFVEQNNRTVSQWGVELRLKRNMVKLSAQYPNYGRVDWLIYFIQRVISKTMSFGEQSQALRHLCCFYQVDFYYLAKQWWFKTKCPQGVYAWTDLFDAIATPFTNLEKAQVSLKDFDPKYTTKSYINKICYRVGRDWLRQKFGAQFEAQLGAVQLLGDAQSPSDDDRAWAVHHKAEELALKEQAIQAEMTQYKVEQHRIWQRVIQSLANLEQQHQAQQLKTLHPSQLTLWDVMSIGYGFNIGQSGVDQILAGNHQRVTQSTICRRLTSFKTQLFLECLHEFSQEIQEGLGHCLPNDETHPDFQKIAKAQHKKLEPLLRTYYQDWIYSTLIKPSLTNDYTASITVEIITEITVVLSHWLQKEFELVLNPSYLSNGMCKKMQAVLELWAQKIRQENG
ncbi:hypothetical protein [Spirulina major]|uniref:hypothetical protein n=1 Tax=Spirulina major TaxID=270636 RepID=UPI001114F7A4|nr:hypothetical protein [Spirulina major]